MAVDVSGFVGKSRPASVATRLLFCTALLLVTAHCTAADDPAGDRPASISIVAAKLQQATVRIVSGTERASGVVVSQDGLVLTVAHGLPTGDRPVHVVLHDGSMQLATVLRSDTARDVALLQLEASDSLRPRPLLFGKGHIPQRSEYVFACGCPGREADSVSGVVRLGQVVAVTESAIRTTCSLTVGDSGGPLVNSVGELIGLNQRIGAAPDQNLHIPVSTCLEAMATWLGPESRRPHSAPASVAISLDATATVQASLRNCSATLIVTGTPSGSSDHELRIPATRISRDRFVTKASLTPHALDAQLVLAPHVDDKAATTVKLVLLHRKLDLAVWHAGSAAGPFDVEALADAAELSATVVFAFAGNRPGIVGRTTHSEPPLPPQLGCTLDADGGLHVRDIAPNSAALDAGLQKDDRLVSADGTVVRDFDGLAAVLVPFQPGDWIALTFRRGRSVFTGHGQLRHDPAEQLARREFLDGRSGELSLRRTGFEDVIQHDIPLGPNECGGPLVDGAGRLVGVNIARRSRESTLAIPIQVVLNLAVQP